MVYFALPVCQLFQQGTVQRFLFGKALFQQKDVVRRGVVSENESMVTPVFATPILTTSWLA
ncbi:hypothetical protein [Enterobacter cloacae]|uniref:hypothetical protein n=1 Tax=Enterobacter cloacae TaxID=550 RepID=UPI0020139754|nr:hypothetical protein [Enterobacter cloacae]